MTSINSDLLHEASTVFNMRKTGMHRRDIENLYGDRSGPLYALGALKLPSKPNMDVAEHYKKYNDIDRTASVKKVSRLTVMLSDPSKSEDTLATELGLEGLHPDTISELLGIEWDNGNVVSPVSDYELGVLAVAGAVEPYSLTIHSRIRLPWWSQEEDGLGYNNIGEDVVAGLFDKGFDHYFWHYGSDLDVEDNQGFIDGVYAASYKFGKNEKRVMLPYRTAAWAKREFGWPYTTVSALRAIVSLPRTKSKAKND